MKTLRFPLAIAFLALVCAAALLFGGPETRVDPAVLHALAIPSIVPAARLLTHIGDGWTVLAGAIAAAAFMVAHDHRRRAILILVILASERLIVEGMKLLFDRARPDVLGRQAVTHSLAFPSGHSANAMAVWLGIALLATGPRTRIPAIALALLLALVTGLCRLILQVHWPSDVIGGWAFGAGWTLLLVHLFGTARPALPPNGGTPG